MKVNLIFDYMAGDGFGAATAFRNNLRANALAGTATRVNCLNPVGADVHQIHAIWALGFYHSLFKRRKLVYTNHLTVEEAGMLRLPTGPLARAVRFLSNRADAIVAPSPYCRGTIAGKRPVAVISNGVDTEKFRPDRAGAETFRHEHGLEGKTVVYSVGMLTAKKGIKDFAALAGRFGKDVKFVWIGRNFPHLRDRKEFDIERLRAQHPEVLFTGYVKNIVHAHSAGDILLFTSSHEIQGMPILEAASMGKPLVLRDIPAYNGWLTDGKDASIGKDAKGMEEKLRTLIEDGKLRERMGKNAFKMAQKHDLGQVGKTYRKFYEAVLNGSRDEIDSINSSYS